MGELLEALHRLQGVELKLAGLRRTEESKKRRINTSRRQSKEAEDQLAKAETAVRDSQMRIDSLTLDVDVREESIDKHRTALSQAKTNKEYAAILTAINTEKADNTKLETQVLQLLEDNKKLKEQVLEIQANRDRLSERIANAVEDLDAFRDRTQEERDRQQAQRDLCAEDIPPEALNTFIRVAERHDGEAMVPVLRLHPKRQEYACSGCNMTLTLEVISSLQTGNELQFCKTCGRLLYLDEQATRLSR